MSHNSQVKDVLHVFSSDPLPKNQQIVEILTSDKLYMEGDAPVRVAQGILQF